jgi:hypothetical protein
MPKRICGTFSRDNPSCIMNLSKKTSRSMRKMMQVISLVSDKNSTACVCSASDSGNDWDEDEDDYETQFEENDQKMSSMRSGFGTGSIHRESPLSLPPLSITPSFVGKFARPYSQNLTLVSVFDSYSSPCVRSTDGPSTSAYLARRFALCRLSQ